MKSSNIKLPSNKNFGYFFSGVFLAISIFFLFLEDQFIAYIFLTLTILLTLITLIKPNLLYQLNRLWMSFGLLLGKIISPIVLGVIFFGLITPYGLVLRLVGRDELKLKLIKKKSHWINRSKEFEKTNFKQQF
jgi:hypothetical protein